MIWQMIVGFRWRRSFSRNYQLLVGYIFKNCIDGEGGHYGRIYYRFGGES